ncbi:hypothetical protein [Thermocatellispora tengchongensis]|uniref:hypothetical protein n=1 Tax=Thermocatellispora tengchongensis TaxID=1073253 RepID=UPI003640A383
MSEAGGTFEARFGPVVAAFAETVTEPQSGGAALSVPPTAISPTAGRPRATSCGSSPR